MTFNDEAGLDAVFARSGQRAVDDLPNYGPTIFAIMQSYGGIFSTNDIRITMGANGFDIINPKHYQKMILNTIYYINASSLQFYVERARVGQSWGWQWHEGLIDKSQFREAEKAHAAASRPIVTRTVQRRVKEQPIVLSPRMRAIANNAGQSAHWDELIVGSMKKLLAERMQPVSAVNSIGLAEQLYLDAALRAQLFDLDAMPSAYTEPVLDKLWCENFPIVTFRDLQLDSE